MVVTTGTPLANAAISEPRRLLAPSGYGWITRSQARRYSAIRGADSAAGCDDAGVPVRPSAGQLAAPSVPADTKENHPDLGPAVEQLAHDRAQGSGDRRAVGAEMAHQPERSDRSWSARPGGRPPLMAEASSGTFDGTGVQAIGNRPAPSRRRSGTQPGMATYARVHAWTSTAAMTRLTAAITLLP